MFAYNYNTPYNLRVCDRLRSVGGIVGDFYGFTELNFPSWELYYDYPAECHDDDPDCLRRPEPHELTEETCPIHSTPILPDMLGDRRFMETYESALVHIMGAQLPEEWVNCDFNGNGDVAYNTNDDQFAPADEVLVPEGYCNPTDGLCSEALCYEHCNERRCAELTNYREFGQYPVTVGGARILVVTDANVPELDPVARTRDGNLTIDRLGGVLREFAPLDDPWIIEPRCRQDIMIEGEDEYPDVPIYQRCVPSEETGDYEDPY